MPPRQKILQGYVQQPFQALYLKYYIYPQSAKKWRAAYILSVSAFQQDLRTLVISYQNPAPLLPGLPDAQKRRFLYSDHLPYRQIASLVPGTDMQLSLVHPPFHINGSPRIASAESGKDQLVAVIKFVFPIVKAERDGCSGCISIFIYIDHHLFAVQSDALG